MLRQKPQPVNLAEHYDILLCYQLPDRSEVKQIAKQLKAHNVNCYPNQWELNSNTEWLDLFTNLVGKINSLAVFVGNNGAPWEDEEVENLIWTFMEDRHIVVFIILPSALQIPEFPPYLKRKQIIVDFRDKVDESILQLIHLISQDGKRGVEHE